MKVLTCLESIGSTATTTAVAAATTLLLLRVNVVEDMNPLHWVWFV